MLHMHTCKYIQAMKTHKLTGYPGYVWITYAWYQHEWWSSATIRCDEEELAQMLRYSLSLGGVPLTKDPEVQTDVGLVRIVFNSRKN